jgi:hypothetical protein
MSKGECLILTSTPHLANPIARATRDRPSAQGYGALPRRRTGSMAGPLLGHHGATDDHADRIFRPRGYGLSGVIVTGRLGDGQSTTLVSGMAIAMETATAIAAGMMAQAPRSRGSEVPPGPRTFSIRAASADAVQDPRPLAAIPGPDDPRVEFLLRLGPSRLPDSPRSFSSLSNVSRRGGD